MTQSNPNRQRNDDVRRERSSVGVYDDNERVDTGTTTPVAGTHGTDPTLDRPYTDTRTTHTEPTTYGTTEPARCAGSSIVSWIVIAIVAIIILWLVFAFLL
jgi:hypothetical protein